MITLIGLGLWDHKDISLNGLEKAKEADLIYLECYTSKLFGCTKKDLEELIGKKIQEAGRSFLETGEILAYAKSNNVALLVPGDPMVATTHSDLILQAHEKGIKTEIIHNASVFSAVAETGLQSYKFGKSATITFWQENFKPTSFINALKANLKHGLHTLFFLDIKTDENSYLSAQGALKTLLDVNDPSFTEETKVVVCSQLGSPNSIINYGKVKDLMHTDIGLPLQVIIVPGNLHDKEKEFLEMFKK